jgi:hypothetical protein
MPKVSKVRKPGKKKTEDSRQNTAEEKQRNTEATDSTSGLNHYSSTPTLHYSKVLRTTDHGQPATGNLL